MYSLRRSPRRCLRLISSLAFCLLLLKATAAAPVKSGLTGSLIASNLRCDS